LWLNPDDKVIRVDKDNSWYVDWVREVDPKKPGLDFKKALDVFGGRFHDGSKDAPAVPQGLVFSADVPSDLPPPVDNLTDDGWVEEAFPWELPVIYANNGLKLSLSKATAPKKVSVKDEAPYYDYGIVNADGSKNPSGATLSYTAKTGLFKGSFKLYYEGLNPKGIQLKAVSVPYSGVMMSDGDGGLFGSGFGTATINKQKKVSIPVSLE
jgi:hypothetical protein